MSHLIQSDHLRIPLNDIKLATNDFSDENCIGKGGFGKVYKGELSISEGRMMVAVKRLDPERRYGQGQREFLMEITMLSRYQHEHIVSLLGFCDENDEMLLVYEHMFHGSLEKHLRRPNLTWGQRLRICCGAARGLSYLHDPDGEKQRLLHRDIKSANILLDEKYDAKIADFGLSKMGPANQQFTLLVTNAAGTPGYCDPVYAETGILTKKSDVYSFGVVLFEVLCGRSCIENYNDGRPFLTHLARKSYEQKKLVDVVYDNMMEQMEPDSLATFSAIAYKCLQKDRKERPTMAEVLDELETALQYQEYMEANVVPSALNQYRLRVIAESPRTLYRSFSYFVCLEIDHEDKLFAVAGYSSPIRVFDFSMFVSESLEKHLPFVDISRSAGSRCLSWNKDTRNHLASGEIEGTVAVWDVNSQQSVIEYKEHKARVDRVDFSCTEPSMLVSAGHDGKVKVWCMKQATSSITIDMVEAVSGIKYHPESSMHIVVGSYGSHLAYYYDLRNTCHPVRTFKGHRDRVTSVRFLSNDELVTGAMDGTLRLWELNRKPAVRIFKGHKQSRHGFGFSVNNDFIACGSATNEVILYHKAFSKPVTWKRLDSIDGEPSLVRDVCWKRDGSAMLTANTNGTLKVLVLET